MTTFRTTLALFDSNVYGYHFPVPTAVVKKFIKGSDRRVICTINNTVTFPCALMPKGDIHYILANKKHRSQLGVQEGDEVEITLKKDTSEFGFPVPESFQYLMDEDPEGSALFRKLTKGKQRSLIYLIQKVKNVDSQINKGLAILYHLRESNGELNYKLLNQRIKEFNQNRKLQ